MARSASALHNSTEAVNDENALLQNNSIITSSPKSTVTENHTPNRPTPSTPKTPKTQKTPVVPSSPLNSSPDRRTRRMWSDAEEACLISGVAKHGMDNWNEILQDPEYSFNNRTIVDLRAKYRNMMKKSESELESATESPAQKMAIFDIRSIDAQVTQVFLGADWSTATWVSVDSIEPESRRERLLADFDRRMQQKQKIVARVSPARTPSHLIASMTLASTAKKRRTGLNSDSDSSPTTTAKAASKQSPMETPLKKTRTFAREAMVLHSDASEEEAEELVYPEEDAVEAPIAAPVKQTRCIIM